MTDKQTIAVLGTGIMGAAMARNLARAGFGVRAWNRTRSKAEALGADGVRVADSPAAAARGAGFVVTMPSNADAVASCMEGPDGALGTMGGDAVWLQCATVGIDGTERLAALAEKAGVPFVDAPVLGTKKPAEDGTLTVLASGPAELEARCRPVFDAVGTKALWLGPAGTGSRLKLVMNSWVLAITAATAEAIALAEGLDLDPRSFLETLSGTAIDSTYAHLKGNAMIARDFAASFPASGAAKDAGLIHDAARSCGISDDVVVAVLAKFRRAVESGHGDDDMTASYLATAAR